MHKIIDAILFFSLRCLVYITVFDKVSSYRKWQKEVYMYLAYKKIVDIIHVCLLNDND